MQSIDRAFDILELLSKQPRGVAVTEIGRRLHLHKSTVHRFLSSLRDRGYIEKDIQTGNYKLGLGFVELASLYLNGLELKTEAGPLLHQLTQATGQTSFLAIKDGRDVVYIDKAETFDSLRRYTIIGKRLPLHATSLGKAMLSGCADEEIERLYAGQQLEQLTKKTIVTLDALLAEIRQVRDRGWAADDEENELGTHCVGAPVFDYRDRVIAAVSTAWDYRVNPSLTWEGLAKYVVRSAASISVKMGCTQSRIRRLAG
ncbi:MAG: IclR family transcriptional regulator [Desulforhopalus sp.]